MDEGCVHVQATQFEFTIAVEQPKQYDGLKVTWTFDKEDGLRVNWTEYCDGLFELTVKVPCTFE